MHSLLQGRDAKYSSVCYALMQSNYSICYLFVVFFSWTLFSLPKTKPVRYSEVLMKIALDRQ